MEHFFIFIFSLFFCKKLSLNITYRCTIDINCKERKRQFFIYSFFDSLQTQQIQMLSQMLNNKISLKTFILQNEKTQFSQVILYPVDYGRQNLDIQEMLSNKVEHFRRCEYRIYDFKSNQYTSLTQITQVPYSIPVDFILSCPSVVLIKFKSLESQEASSYKQTESQSDQNKPRSQTSSIKKQRSKQRVIAEVIQIIKRWRDIHLQKRGQKKISLQQAAKIVGLPKKSLDDYYYQLRLGQKYGFDFKGNFYERIGILRNFLKQRKPRLKSQTVEKRPKNLKVIQNFEELRQMSKYYKMEQQEIYQQNQQMGRQKMEQGLSQQREQNQVKLQNQFYEDFGFLEEQQDPFVSMDSNFKKKKEEKIFDQQLFF